MPIDTSKVFPKEIAREVEKTLAHYPELLGVPIEFKFNKIGVQSYMLAQPKVKSLWRSKKKRQYRILIRRDFFIDNPQFDNRRVPSDVMIGWLGHELGHIMDYKDRSALNLIFFGFCYYFFTPFLKKAEITADKNAVKAGLIEELALSKVFGRDPQYFPQSYIDKLNGLYPSIETVKHWAKVVDQETGQDNPMPRAAQA